MMAKHLANQVSKALLRGIISFAKQTKPDEPELEDKMVMILTVYESVNKTTS